MPFDINKLMAMPNAILAVAVVLGMAIFFHEAGHFLMARLCGIGVDEFSVGFWKPLWQRRVSGPNLMPGWSFESMEAGLFAADAPFSVVADPRASTSKADVHAALSRSGKCVYSWVGVSACTEYVSSLWVRGSGAGTLFVATDDLSERLASVPVTASADWREVSLTWNSAGLGGVAVGFQDDASDEGEVWLGDCYTGLAGTLYSLRVIPVGGYAKIVGMEPGEMDMPGGIYAAPRYKQAAVFAAGVGMNVVFAMILFLIVVFWKGLPDANVTGITVDRPLSGSAAAKAGFLPGDKVDLIDGHKVCLLIDKVNPKGVAAKAGLIKNMAIGFAWDEKVAVPTDLLALITANNVKVLPLVVEDPKAKSLGEIYKRVDMPATEELRALAEFTPTESPEKLDELVGRALGVEWAPMTSGAMADYIGRRPERKIDVAVLRQGRPVVISVVPTAQFERQPELGPTGMLVTPQRRVGRIGVLLGAPRRPAGFVEGVKTAALSTVGSVTGVVTALHAVATRQISAEGSGPVGIIAMTAEQARIGWDAVLSLGGLISANLAVVNLLPVPPFDGFYVLMVGWEGVTRRRVNEHIRHTLVAAGFIVIIALLFVLTYKDIFNIVRYGTP